MKNQYFGDINDYRKYGLIRSILRTGEFRPLIAWMLTHDEEGSPDGKFTDYLSGNDNERGQDPELYKSLQRLMQPNAVRRVALIEQTNLLPGARYFSPIVPDASHARNAWTKELLLSTKDSDLVFLDPDNGLEVKSKPCGRKGSSKYLYWHEVSELWKQGKSLLIYQHFCREERRKFVHRVLYELQKHTIGSLVEAFSTSYVVFILALQLEHKRFHPAIVADVQARWSAQINIESLMSRRGTQKL